jgi:hypothetical protein
MAEDKAEKLGECCHISVCKAENGYKICCTYEGDQNKLSVRAGWCPPTCTTKDYVEKSKDAVVKRVKELL